MTTVQRASRAQERRLAKTLGGRRQKASGAAWTAKGDISTDRFLVEAKGTTGEGIRVTREWASKIFREAVSEGKIPVIALDIRGTRLMVMFEDDWVEMAEGSE